MMVSIYATRILNGKRLKSIRWAVETSSREYVKMTESFQVLSQVQIGINNDRHVL